MSASYIGVNFGTAYASISVITKEGTIQTIANEDGDRNIPCCVAYSPHGEVLVGSQAKVQSVRNPRNTLVGFRNLVGLSYHEALTAGLLTKSQMRIEPFDNSPNALPIYKVDAVEGDETVELRLTVKQVAVQFFESLKSTAESFLGREITGCVVSYPSTFTNAQYDALLDIANTVFAEAFLIKEPIAAVLAYNDSEITSTNAADKRILVSDFGAHQFNVTIVRESKGLLCIRTSVDDYKLGGQDLDATIADFARKEFSKKTRVDLSDNPRALAKLKNACEMTKKMLSQKDVAPCYVESLYDGMDFSTNINRGRFEMLAEPLLQKCPKVISEALRAASLNAEDIDQVLLVGGCSRIPRYQAIIKGIFPDRVIDSNGNTQERVLMNVNVDEAIAIGCAIFAKDIASIGIDEYKENLNATEFYTNVPLLAADIGIKNDQGEFVSVILKGTPLPAIRHVQVTNAANNPGCLNVEVLEKDQDSRSIATLQLAELTKSGLKGSCVVDVTFTIEADLKLKVSARERDGEANVQVLVS